MCPGIASRNPGDLPTISLSSFPLQSKHSPQRCGSRCQKPLRAAQEQLYPHGSEEHRPAYPRTLPEPIYHRLREEQS